MRECGNLISSEVKELREPPLIYISYRWGEYDEWVAQFVSDIHRNGVEVIFDKWARDQWSYKNVDDLLNMLFKAMEKCHIFVPIFTPAYLIRAGYKNGQPITGNHPDDGVVYEEFIKSLSLSQYKQIETVAVLLEGSEDVIPEPFTINNVLDMRDPLDYEKRLQEFLIHVHHKRMIMRKRPKFSGTMQDGIITYDENE